MRVCQITGFSFNCFLLFVTYLSICFALTIIVSYFISDSSIKCQLLLVFEHFTECYFT